MISCFRIVTVGICFTLFAVCAAAQDLGSSNKLFGGPAKKESTPVKSVKKAPPSRKPASAKPKAPAKKAPARAAAVKKKQPPAKTAAKSAKITPPAAKTVPADGRARSVKPKKMEDALQSPKKTETAESTQRFTRHIDPAADDLFEELIENGNFARDQRNYAVAEFAYTRAKSIKPLDARAVYGLGNLYTDQQRWEEAEKAYRSALEIDPKNATAQVALSYVLTQPVSAPNLSERYEEAEKLARAAIKLAPLNPLAFDQLGVALELRGLIDAETENAYRRSIQLDPGFAPSYAHLGRLLRRRGLLKESAAAYQNAIERSNDVATMLIVADVMQSELRFAESEKLLRKALLDDPKNPTALLLLGRALMTQLLYVEAEDVLRRSLQVSPNGFLAHSLLGDLYIRQGKHELAESALLQAARFASSYDKRSLAGQFEAVGDGYRRSAKGTQAERAYRQSRSLDADRESLNSKL